MAENYKTDERIQRSNKQRAISCLFNGKLIIAKMSNSFQFDL